MPEAQNLPPDLEDGRLLFTQESRFVKGAAEASQAPDSRLPEIAFAGRSNVGKSSLINALCGRKALARTARTPGRTREINFFDLGHRLMLADLPGYGYARAPKPEIARWTREVKTYLAGRGQLRRALVLIDGRHGIKPADMPAIDLLDTTGTAYQIVLTKCDKVKKADLAALKAEITAGLPDHPACLAEILATSSRRGDGIAELRAVIAALAS